MATASNAAVVAALLLASAPALANDSTAELGLGGLTLTRSADIVMESEDLFVSEARITVDYVFVNTSGRDIETTVAFPLPDVTHGVETMAWDYESELAFRTTVDGAPADLKLVYSAVLKGKDVGERLRAANIPLMPVYDRFEAAVKALSPQVRDALIAEGLFEPDGATPPGWTPLWTTRTAVTRTQVFPAGKPIRVSHAYKPLAGGSVGSILSPGLRDMPDVRKEVTAYRAKYCIDDAFVRGFDAARGKKKDVLQPDVWLSYVLTSGANWNGPIRSFRLVVDKGDPKNMVSFCADGVKKISPTRFEVVYRDFTPTRDLNVLIVRPPME